MDFGKLQKRNFIELHGTLYFDRLSKEAQRAVRKSLREGYISLKFGTTREVYDAVCKAFDIPPTVIRKERRNWEVYMSKDRPEELHKRFKEAWTADVVVGKLGNKNSYYPTCPQIGYAYIYYQFRWTTPNFTELLKCVTETPKYRIALAKAMEAFAAGKFDF